MIVEYTKDIDIFLSYWNTEPCLVVPIWCDHQKHPMDNDISFLYVRFEDQETDDGDVITRFIIPLNHNDCINIPEIDLSKSTQPKWVWNKKGLLQTNLGIQNTYDIQTHIYFTTNELHHLEDKLDDLTNFYTRLGITDDLGKSIPIMKYMEILDSETKNLPINENFGNSWVNSDLIPTLSRIERKGIYVASEKFFKRWPKQAKFLKAGRIYTEYNPYTPTTRPSNRHGGINFGALNKKDGTRECFIPSPNNDFLQYDYDAYHVRLIADLIGFTIPHEQGHQWLADMYGCSYDESKPRTFRIIYGGVSDEDRKIPFFQQVDDYIQELWKQMEMNGYIETPKKRKIYLKFIENPTPQKVFNYLLQSTETEYNIDVIKKLYEEGIDELVLYQYDSFLFDFESTFKSIDQKKVWKIKGILESKGFPVKGTWGTDYSKV